MVSFASEMAASLRQRFLFPMFLKAQFTAFFTKFRSSVAPLFITGNTLMKSSSFAVLLCHAKQAINAKAARLTKTSSRMLHSEIFFHAKGDFSNRFMQTWSQTSHESKPTTQ